MENKKNKKLCTECGKEIPTYLSYKQCDVCRHKETLRVARARNVISKKLKKREKGERLLNPVISKCSNYDGINLTCIRCLENGEEKYRGCFKKKA